MHARLSANSAGTPGGRDPSEGHGNSLGRHERRVGSLGCATLPELLELRSREHPHRKAFTFLENGDREGESVSYAELDLWARRIGKALEEAGAGGGRVVLLYPSCLDFVAAFFGCLYAGATVVPALPALTGRGARQLEAIVSDCRPVVLLTTASFKNVIVRAGTLRLGPVSLVSTDDMRGVKADTSWSRVEVGGEEMALLQYTSGSTGSPKGVMVTHSNILHNQEFIRERFEHSEDDMMAGWLPMFHDMGLIGDVLQPIYVGAHCVLMSPGAFLQDPRRWLLTITRHGVVSSGGPNFAYDLCVDRIPRDRRDGLELHTWQVAFNGAEPVRPSTLERFATEFEPYGFRREAFYPCYGQAEATLMVTGGARSSPPALCEIPETAEGDSAKRGETRRPHVVGCGSSSPDQRVIIVDEATCLPVSEGQVGEIWISGPSVALGYWDKPKETQSVFQARLAVTGEGPFLRTGDLGFVLERELYVTGRSKEVMIVRGRNHYPQDIEETAGSSHSALVNGGGAAFLIEDAGSEHVVVVCEVHRNFALEGRVGEIAGNVRETVVEAHGLRVNTLVLIEADTLPRTSSGKIQRRLCRDLYLAGQLPMIARDPTRSREGTSREMAGLVDDRRGRSVE